MTNKNNPIPTAITLDPTVIDVRTGTYRHIDFNILMNGILSTENYIKQHEFDNTIIGTQALETDTLIALVRSRTSIGTWYEECFYDFFDNFTQPWGSLNDRYFK